MKKKKLVPLDSNLHRQLKELALKEDVTLTSLIEEAVEMLLIGRMMT